MSPFSAELLSSFLGWIPFFVVFFSFFKELGWAFLKKNKNQTNNKQKPRQPKPNNHTKKILFFLQEADGAKVNPKLLLGSPNVHRCNVHNGQARGLLRAVLDDCLAPLPGVFLREKWAKMGLFNFLKPSKSQFEPQFIVRHRETPLPSVFLREKHWKTGFGVTIPGTPSPAGGV